jgi:general secretion pathway protein L
VESEKTELNQKDNASTPPVEAPEKAVVKLRVVPQADSQNVVPQADSRNVVPQTDSRNQVFFPLIPDGLTQVIAIVPAELVALHAIDLPVRSARQRAAALPFALEDAVGSALEHSHFAQCGTTAQGKTLAAVMDVATFKTLRDISPDHALVPEQLLLAPASVDPDGPAIWRAYRQEDRVLVRVSDGSGFAVQSGMLAALWQVAEMPVIENYGAALPVGIDVVDHSQMPLPLNPRLFEGDLRQGVFQPPRGLARPLKWLAACLVVTVLGHLGLAAADSRAQRSLADHLQEQARGLLATHLPDARADDAPALIQRRLSAQHQPQRGSTFLPLMDRVSQTLLAQESAVQFRQLNWSEDALRLTLEAADLDALQQAEASLKNAGLRVTSGSATADAGAARAELTVRP